MKFGVAKVTKIADISAKFLEKRRVLLLSIGYRCDNSIPNSTHNAEGLPVIAFNYDIEYFVKNLGDFQLAINRYHDLKFSIF